MKKTFILAFLSIASLWCAAVAGAQAVRVNPDGTGQALIYPYYTVRNGWVTLLSVVNQDTAAAKAVRVRVVEGRRGATVASFNLFLRGADVWTGAIVPGTGADDPPALISADQSCTGGDATLQRSPGFRLPFTAAAYQGDSDVAAFQTIDRTREGFVEIIEIGVVPRGTRLYGQLSPPALTPRSPPPCDAVHDGDVTAYAHDVLPPRGGLSGSGTLLNVGGGMSADYAATAIDHLWAGDSNDFGRLTRSDDTSPSLASGSNRVAEVFVEGQLHLLPFAKSVDAVSATLMTTMVKGEFAYTFDRTIGTAWVFAAPTRRYYVSGTGTQPFSKGWGRQAATACEYGQFYDSFDREAWGGTLSFDVYSGAPPSAQEGVCFHATVFSFSPYGIDVTFSSKNNYSGYTRLAQDGGSIVASPGREGGFASFFFANTAGLTSTGSYRTVVSATGEVNFETSGPKRLAGLPVIGVGVSTAAYSTGNPQQNYASSIPLTVVRSLVTP